MNTTRTAQFPTAGHYMAKAATMPKVIVTETDYGMRVECDSDKVAQRECSKYEQGRLQCSLVAGMGDVYVFDVYL